MVQNAYPKNKFNGMAYIPGPTGFLLLRRPQKISKIQQQKKPENPAYKRL